MVFHVGFADYRMKAVGILVLLLQQVQELVEFSFIHAPAIIDRRINSVFDFLIEFGSTLNAASEDVGVGLGVLGHGLCRDKTKQIEDDHLRAIGCAAGCYGNNGNTQMLWSAHGWSSQWSCRSCRSPDIHTPYGTLSSRPLQ